MKRQDNCPVGGEPCQSLCADHCRWDSPRQNPLMAQTPAERQEARRKRLLMEGLTEVRGIFLHPDKHAELKAYAKRLAKKKSKQPTNGA